MLMSFFKNTKLMANRFLSRKILDLKSLGECYPEATIRTSRQIVSECIDTQDLLDMPLLPQTEHLRCETYASQVPYTAVLHDAGVCTDDNTIVCGPRTIVLESSNTRSKASLFDWKAHIFKKKMHMDGMCTVIRSGGVIKDYYHNFIDSLPRLFLLKEEPFSELPEIKLLIPNRFNRIEEYFLEKLLPENVKPVFLESGCVYTVETLIMPSFLTPVFVAYLPKPYMDFFLQRVLPERRGTKDKRIFISRAKAARRRVDNEGDLLAFLKARGFESYLFEELTMSEQIELMHDAGTVVTAHGAALTNLLFSSGAKVFELFGIPRVKPNYYYLCKCVGNEYRYVCHGARGINDDFTVDIDQLKAKLDECGVQ